MVSIRKLIENSFFSVLVILERKEKKIIGGKYFLG